MNYSLEREGASGKIYSIEELRQLLVSGTIQAQERLKDERGYSVNLSDLMSGPSVPPPPLPPPPPPPLPQPMASLPPPVTHGGGGPPRKKKKIWPWVLLGVSVLGFLGLLFVGMIVFIIKTAIDLERLENEPAAVTLADAPLMLDRAGHQTRWEESSFEANGAADTPPEDLFQLIHYPSPAGQLAAYLSPDPGDGKKHPIMIWAKGGFGGIGDFLWEESSRTNDQSAKAFREAGILMMCPSWRGENDNPGRFELFYGEVDDFLAAIEYARTLPYVDPERIYIGGHSTGGTQTLLAAVAGANFRAAFSFGGAPDMVDIMSDGLGYDNTPYAMSSTRDHELRSPIRYVNFIKHPVFYFEGEDSLSYVERAYEMERLAELNDIPFTPFELPGDHFALLAPITELIAQKIMADTGAECSIDFTQKELEQHWYTMQNKTLVTEIAAWEKKGGDLQDYLDPLQADRYPVTTAGAQALSRAVVQLTRNDAGWERTNDLSYATSCMHDTDDLNAMEVLADMACPALGGWLKRTAVADGSLTEDQTNRWFTVLGVVAWQDAESCGELVAEMMKGPFAAKEYGGWKFAFDQFEVGSDGFTRLFEISRGNPPSDLAAWALLDVANKSFLNEWEGVHPFDSPAGKVQLEKWLAPDSDVAYDATLALAFCSEGIRNSLLPMAYGHPDRSVQLEAAWSDLKHEGTKGLQFLKKACLDPNTSVTARNYLTELERAEEIPAAALEPEFNGLAQMIKWLKHPNELGKEPSSIKQIDNRELFWPPTGKKEELRLFEYTYRFDDEEPLSTAYGIQGADAVTFSSFTAYKKPPSLADLYSHYCQLALAYQNRQEDEAEVSEEAAREMLKKSNPGLFEPK